MRVVANAAVIVAVILLLSACSSAPAVGRTENLSRNDSPVPTDGMSKTEVPKVPDVRIEPVVMSGADKGTPPAAVLNGGQPAFNFSLRDTSGKQHTLADYKGKKVYIKYWASWCSVCLGGPG